MILNTTLCWGSKMFGIIPKLLLESQAPIANGLHNSTWVLFEPLIHNMSNIALLILAYSTPMPTPQKICSSVISSTCDRKYIVPIAQAKHLWITPFFASFIPLHSTLLKILLSVLWNISKIQSLFTTFSATTLKQAITISLLDDCLNNTKDLIIK